MQCVAVSWIVLQCVAVRRSWVQCPRCGFLSQIMSRTRGECKRITTGILTRESASQNSDPNATDFVLDL